MVIISIASANGAQLLHVSWCAVIVARDTGFCPRVGGTRTKTRAPALKGKASKK